VASAVFVIAAYAIPAAIYVLHIAHILRRQRPAALEGQP